MNLETKWLEDFVALAATRSFSQAAEKRFVTQPAFSRRMRSIEAALGLTLRPDDRRAGQECRSRRSPSH